MAKIRQSNLDNSIVTGLTDLGSNVASGDQTLVYDVSTGTLKKISQSNFLNLPTISSVSPTSATSGDGTGNHTFTITGSGFTGASADLVNNSGTAIAFDTVTVNSNTQITGVIAKSSLPNSGEPYDVRVTGNNGLRAILENQINIDQSPTFNTASGSLGTMIESGTFNFTVEAFDPESAGNVNFEIQSGSIPAGLTTSTIHENGVSKFIIGGTASAVGSDTTSTFTVRAYDSASNTSSRQFSITVANGGTESFTSSGTFSVPNGLTSVTVLVVAGGAGGGNASGGGGGAGGLIYMPGYPVTPGGTVSVTVGCGGANGGPGASGQDSVFGTLTAKGGGGGGGPRNQAGVSGGSGGGAGAGAGPTSFAAATQPTQPGNSGSYGFGHNGGGSGASPNWGAGGGGGAGAGGDTGGPYQGGNGGIGKAYTIADGTTPVYYSGGGGGATDHGSGTVGQGGQGGGAAGGGGGTGQANKGGGGGGGGGGDGGGPAGGPGGKGIVIVSY